MCLGLNGFGSFFVVGAVGVPGLDVSIENPVPTVLGHPLGPTGLRNILRTPRSILGHLPLHDQSLAAWRFVPRIRNSKSGRETTEQDITVSVISGISGAREPDIAVAWLC